MRYIALFVLIVLNCLLLVGSFVAHKPADEFIAWEGTTSSALTFEPQEEKYLELVDGAIVYFDGKKRYKILLEEVK